MISLDKKISLVSNLYLFPFSASQLQFSFIQFLFGSKLAFSRILDSLYSVFWRSWHVRL